MACSQTNVRPGSREGSFWQNNSQEDSQQAVLARSIPMNPQQRQQKQKHGKAVDKGQISTCWVWEEDQVWSKRVIPAFM
jgi:hypothetical protein